MICFCLSLAFLHTSQVSSRGSNGTEKTLLIREHSANGVARLGSRAGRSPSHRFPTVLTRRSAGARRSVREGRLTEGPGRFTRAPAGPAVLSSSPFRVRSETMRSEALWGGFTLTKRTFQSPRTRPASRQRVTVGIDITLMWDFYLVLIDFYFIFCLNTFI